MNEERLFDYCKRNCLQAQEVYMCLNHELLSRTNNVPVRTPTMIYNISARKSLPTKPVEG